MSEGTEVSGPQGGAEAVSRGPECGDCGALLDLASPYRCVCRVSKTDDSGWAEWIRAYRAGEIEMPPPNVVLDVVREVIESEAGYPAPLVSTRDGVEPASGWPGPVALLASEAEMAGWRVQLAYARGCMPHATTGRPGAPRDSYSVRFAKGDWQGYAIYGGSPSSPAWQSIMVTGRELPPFGMMGRTDLTTWLAGPEKLGPQWYDVVRRRVAQQEADRKAREACNKGVHDRAEVVGGGIAGVWCRRCKHGWTGTPWRKPKGKGEAL